MASTAAAQTDERDLPWWLVLIEGIALIIMGIFLLSKPGMTTLIVVQFLGIYWFVVGIFRIISIFIDSSLWGWKLFAGVLGILAGIVVVRHPLWSSAIVGLTLIIVLGIQGIIVGLIGVFQAFKGAGWTAGILGAVSAILGVVLLLNAWVFTFSLPWVLGILALIGGIAAIVAAFRLK
jgi:uncharacterized membrane protein HdeD (DUF308 family)